MLLHADIPENYVAQLRGHKSSKSLQSYKLASSKHQRRMPLTPTGVDTCSVSEDETLSSVHNHDLQVATRSTAATSTSTTEN